MNKLTISLIIAIILLVGCVCILTGYNLQLQSQQPVISQNNTTPTATVQNNTTTPTVSTDAQPNSEWMAKTCKRCGGTFYVPVNGEQLNYCDNCLREMGYL